MDLFEAAYKNNILAKDYGPIKIIIGRDDVLGETKMIKINDDGENVKSEYYHLFEVITNYPRLTTLIFHQVILNIEFLKNLKIAISETPFITELQFRICIL